MTQNDDGIIPEPSEEFVSTSRVQEITEHALTYLSVGYAIHFAGSAGTGKTTLAFHVAAKLGRPVALLHGDEDFGSSDLIGQNVGYHKSRVVDNFIHSVLKTEENMRTDWVDNQLAIACRNGYTLIYDEFNRSRPEANNVLLSILEEGVLSLPKLQGSGGARNHGYLQVHPEFYAIFTSNPEEYVGTHKTQDALMDRLITIQVGHYDRETEIEIAMAKSGISRADAETIVDIVRELRKFDKNGNRPTIRASIAMSRILSHSGSHARWEDKVFQWVCQDILHKDISKMGQEGMSPNIEELIKTICHSNC
jgi:gas vesicle protein GvpN